MTPFVRIDNFSSADSKLVKAELDAGKEVIIQFASKIYSDDILAELDTLCNINDRRLCIRFYGHYHETFDCTILLLLPHVKCLHIDCLQKADNLEEVAKLNYLQELRLGIFELKQNEVLNFDNLKALHTLSVSDTKNSAINLDYLRDYKQLESLTVVGHKKNINTIGDVHSLQHLSLHLLKKEPTNFVNRLQNLKSLSFILGSRENIQEITNPSIRKLEIVRVRGFNDLSNIACFSNLEELSIEDQIQLNRIDFNRQFSNLIKLRISNCKTFDTLIGLNNLTTLKSLVIYGTAIEFKTFIQQPLPDTLVHISFHTTKAKIDKDIKAVLEAQGYSSK